MSPADRNAGSVRMLSNNEKEIQNLQVNNFIPSEQIRIKKLKAPITTKNSQLKQITLATRLNPQ